MLWLGCVYPITEVFNIWTENNILITLTLQKKIKGETKIYRNETFDKIQHACLKKTSNYKNNNLITNVLYNNQEKSFKNGKTLNIILW